MNQILMKTLFKKSKTEWETLAKIDPLWAILGEKNKRFEGWNSEEFFTTGEDEITSEIAYIREKRIPLRKVDRVLDFGCGVGRLTRALSKYFPEIYGVDISETMVKKAKKLNQKYTNCNFFVNKGGNLLLFPDNYFDFIYSNLVLQHFPNEETILKQIAEFVRVLKPSGVALFQLPSSLTFETKLHPRRRVHDLLKKVGFKEEFLYFKLHTYGFSLLSISTEKVKGVLRKNSAEIIDIRNAKGMNTKYLIKKMK